jgi:uncharacterized protein YegL
MPSIDVEFAMNPDPRCACVLLLDTSASMAGAAIEALNQALQAFQRDLQEDPLARRRVEIALVTFGNGGVTRMQDFVSAGAFVAPQLETGGTTPMGEAITLALEIVLQRKSEYKKNGVAYYQPWIFMLTDGAPDPDSPWKRAAERVRAEMSSKSLVFFAVGVAGADRAVLSAITPRALMLEGLKFCELFIWLSQSQKRVSGSKPGEQAALPEVTFGSPV